MGQLGVGRSVDYSMALLETHGLVKFYGSRKVVDGVSFEVNPGEVVGLLGPNGAGKTTSFRMTTGQIVPNEGRVIFNGQDVTDQPMYKRARSGMGYLTQEQSIFRKLTVEKNILAILQALPRSRSLGRRLSKAERHARTDEVLERFQLTHVRKNPAARCSGGEKRRLEIARCLVCEPLLILLDEPFAAVDPITTEDIRRNIRELAQQGIGILLTDHNVREVLKITDRSYLIKDGRVVTKGTPQQLINDPIAIREYLGTTFSDNIFGGQPLPPEKTLAENDPMKRMVDHLQASDTARAAAERILASGKEAIPALVDALGRPQVELRIRAYDLLKRIVAPTPLVYDPNAGDAVRARQLAALRSQLKV